MTLNDLKEKLKQLDEITVMELLDISSEDLVDRFEDFIEEAADVLESQFEEEYEETDPWFEGSD